jgi:hypothetical protein
MINRETTKKLRRERGDRMKEGKVKEKEKRRERERERGVKMR